MIMRLCLILSVCITSVYGMDKNSVEPVFILMQNIYTKELASTFFLCPYNDRAFNRLVLERNIRFVYRDFDTMTLDVSFDGTNFYRAEYEYEIGTELSDMTIVVSRYRQEESHDEDFRPGYVFHRKFEFKINSPNEIKLPAKLPVVKFPIEIEIAPNGKFVVKSDTLKLRASDSSGIEL